MNPKLSLVRCLIAAFLAMLFAGCVGTPKTSTAESKQSESYTYVTEVGSRIPKKVKTDGTTASGQNSETMGQEGARRMAEEQARRAATSQARAYGG